MKLSKQERIGLMIIIAVVILALGAFLMVKPKIEEASRNKESMENKQKEFDEKKAKADTKDSLKTQIMDAYEKGVHTADMFFTEMKAYETDDMFREFLDSRTGDKSKVLIEQISVTEQEVVELEPIFPEKETNSYPLKEFATQGTSTLTPAETRNAMLQQALGSAQQLSASTISLEISAIDQEDLIKFTDEINNFMRDEGGQKTRKALMLSGMAVSYPEITNKYDELIEEAEEKAKQVGGEELFKNTGFKIDEQQGTPSNTPKPLPSDEEPEKAALADYVHSCETTITFYSIERMQDPSPILKSQDDSLL